jgi:hypothetical protein
MVVGNLTLYVSFHLYLNGHTIRRELVIGTVIFHTLMEMMSYMSNARCVQSTWKFIN